MARKPVFVFFGPGLTQTGLYKCKTTDDGKGLEILDLGSRGIIPYNVAKRRYSHDAAHFSCRPDEPITHLTVCNNFLVMAMTNGVIMRLDLEHADEPDSKLV